VHQVARTSTSVFAPPWPGVRWRHPFVAAGRRLAGGVNSAAYRRHTKQAESLLASKNRKPSLTRAKRRYTSGTATTLATSTPMSNEALTVDPPSFRRKSVRGADRSSTCGVAGTYTMCVTVVTAGRTQWTICSYCIRIVTANCTHANQPDDPRQGRVLGELEPSRGETLMSGS